uniref:Uncharacterized protein n=1 Tax=Setaria viridis TaxID=4556 RepID=A0A4U6T9W2_SETVI|nr:hypothetical protein SEVIR_9G474000v2 [Setaria viridis]
MDLPNPNSSIAGSRRHGSGGERRREERAYLDLVTSMAASMKSMELTGRLLDGGEDRRGPPSWTAMATSPEPASMDPVVGFPHRHRLDLVRRRCCMREGGSRGDGESGEREKAGRVE